MKQIHHLMQIQKIEADEREQLNDLWARVCYRLDIYALAITQCANAVILMVWLSME